MTNYEILLKIVNDSQFSNIQSLQSLPLKQIANDKVLLSKDQNGLYALSHPKAGIIYIGKGKPIVGRLMSHLKATKGHEKAPAWRQFFHYFSSDLTAHYLIIPDQDDPQTGELIRRILEQLLVLKHQPLFEKLYPEKKNRSIRNFNRKVEQLIRERGDSVAA